MNDLQYIKEHVSKREILARLYEATADLGYSALKLRNILTGGDPFPEDYDKFFEKLIVKSADVSLCLSLLWDVDARAAVARMGLAACWRRGLEDRCHEEAERL